MICNYSTETSLVNAVCTSENASLRVSTAVNHLNVTNALFTLESLA